MRDPDPPLLLKVYIYDLGLYLCECINSITAIQLQCGGSHYTKMAFILKMFKNLVAEDNHDDAHWDSLAFDSSPNLTIVQDDSRSRMVQSTEKSTQDDAMPNFEPINFFLYGTLMIPPFLNRILNLDDDPVLPLASISNFKIRLRGISPALVPCEPEESGRIVNGAIYEVTKKEHLDILISYEGSDYKLEAVTIRTVSGNTGHEVEKQGMAFIWNGRPEDLMDGDFGSLLSQLLPK
ncbi:hypothetical protein H072_1304 [Dactylellina haptotyla CBS 200.50]|uniref:Putative gamma-glutamylcyclotransferase n=1 Tax=Dactylellina haptotyla (strain CBS 200.50) TaxID=1284197 RepID=S8AP34_DACHA|nr:hypothetical protein H072_1304 [Dactylellina haptotyla CBS 200.50]